MSEAAEHLPRVAIVGGGLAGLATAVALADQGFSIELFEARRRWGGRASSFEDTRTGGLVDHCQHVSMGCCTNLADFARRVGIDHDFRRHRVLHFIGPDGRQYDFRGSAWLPPPLHLLPGLLKLGYLSWRERLAIVRAMPRLARWRQGQDDAGESIGAWLRRQGQTPHAMRCFWSVVLVSALGEQLDRAGIRYARQVFVDGFMASRDGYVVEIPSVPLAMLYGKKLAGWLCDHGVKLHPSTPIGRIEGNRRQVQAVVTADQRRLAVDFVVSAVPWRALARLLEQPAFAAVAALAQAAKIQSSPITGVHLWFDRPITPLPHAVLVDRLSQWVFYRGTATNNDDSTTDESDHLSPNAGAAESRAANDPPAAEHYYQIVISAWRNVAAGQRDDVVRQIVEELRDVWPEARKARLIRWRLVTEGEAVFSATPDVDRLRPSQQTEIANLFLAGDWTATGWPSTMEGAVRSGYLAAEGVLRAVGRPRHIVKPDLPRGFLARWLMGHP